MCVIADIMSTAVSTFLSLMLVMFIEYSWNSSVSIATRLWAGQARNFILHQPEEVFLSLKLFRLVVGVTSLTLWHDANYLHLVLGLPHPTCLHGIQRDINLDVKSRKQLA